MRSKGHRPSSAQARTPVYGRQYTGRHRNVDDTFGRTTGRATGEPV